MVSAPATVRFAESDGARWAGTRPAGAAIDVGAEDEVIGMDVTGRHGPARLTENGFGKRTPSARFRKTHRGPKGCQTIALTEAKGQLAGALVVREHEDLIFDLARGHGAAHRRRGDQPLRPRRPGREGHEHP